MPRISTISGSLTNGSSAHSGTGTSMIGRSLPTDDLICANDLSRLRDPFTLPMSVGGAFSAILVRLRRCYCADVNARLPRDHRFAAVVGDVDQIGIVRVRWQQFLWLR